MGPTSRSTLANRFLHRGLLAGIDAEGLHRAAVGRDLVDQRLGLCSVAPRHADLQVTGGEASGNGGADGISGANEQGDGPAGCHARFPCFVFVSLKKTLISLDSSAASRKWIPIAVREKI